MIFLTGWVSGLPPLLRFFGILPASWMCLDSGIFRIYHIVGPEARRRLCECLAAELPGRTSASRRGGRSRVSQLPYKTAEEAKLAAFDEMMEMKQKEET